MVENAPRPTDRTSTDGPEAARLLHSLLAATATRIGKDFFLTLVRELSLGCGTDFALVSALDPADPSRVTTLAVSKQGAPIENFSYSIASSPCEKAIGRGLYLFPSGVSHTFPKFALPGARVIDGYIGITLVSSSGRPLGLLSLLHGNPIDQPAIAESLLQAVAARAGAELEREQVLDALRESETFLRLTQRVGKSGSWEWDLRTNRVRWSDELCRLHGLQPGEFGGTLDAAVQFIHTEDRAQVGEIIRKIVQDHEPLPVEYRVVRKDGQLRWFWGRGEMFKDAAGRESRVVGNVIDVTDRKQAESERLALEEKMRHAQRLESLGVLAGGIAHDFNNLLTSMMGYSGLARNTLPAGSPALPYLAEVGRAAARASELTHQLLAYSGKGKLVVEALPLDALVREMHGLLQTVVSKKAVTRLDLKPATVEADAAQIRQVVMNLITNASDALSSRPGEVAVSTGVRDMTDEAIQSPYLKQPLAGGRYAFLEVSDTGIGMDEATVGRIFDPFFTTKGPGRGLGLAAALGIVHGHRGSLQVSSIPGKGSTFRVFLPAAEAKFSGPAETARGPAAETGALLLVVDDEASVRNFMKTALESADYRVLAACDGQEGLEVFAANRGEIRAVVLDLTMPRMDGWEVLARLRAIDPDLPVVLTSGYTEPALPAMVREGDAPLFVQKPFLMETLVEKVRLAICERKA